ncbi:hypothetical protein IQ17_03621 [Bradyrhizobium daqingense]|uniref:Uncharacterized protein n=1 Tax=Bradyrhizobium daqingense TaxID=993502 RepID=A0A562L9E8_9BRAD|nr:hypothetical protein IQ17_03621 [Bradyrhizobium daqingense]
MPRTQRSASSAVCCRAGAHVAAFCRVAFWVPALRSSVGRCSASGTRPLALGCFARRQPLPAKIFHFTEIRNCGIDRDSPARRRGAVRESFETRAGLRWTRQRRARKARAGRIALREPEASCGRTALTGSSRWSFDGNVHKAVGAGGVKRIARTAKPCGPGRRCYGQALANAAVASTGAMPAAFVGVREARTNSAPGRARHKPSDHRAGKAVCSAPPVCCCAVFCVHLLRSRPRVRGQHPAFPAPSDRRGSDEAKLGRNAPRGCESASAIQTRMGRASCRLILRHCERSEAIQNLSAEGFWIASSQGLLAMTWRARAHTPLLCPGRSAAPLRCAAEPGPMSPSNPCRPGSRLCAAALHAAARPGHERPKLPAGSRTPAARTDARPARS